MARLNPLSEAGLINQSEKHAGKKSSRLPSRKPGAKCFKQLPQCKNERVRSRAAFAAMNLYEYSL
jgi:hypothetical protein